jgi:hypothetical protein
MRTYWTELAFLTLAALTSCQTGSNAVDPVIQRPESVAREYGDGLTDAYVSFVERGRRYFRDGEFILAEAYFERAAAQPIFEAPNYEVWLELAETKCRLVKTRDALDLLDKFDLVMRVDYGDVHCFAGAQYGGDPNPVLPPPIFTMMCSEDFSLLSEGSPPENYRREAEQRRLRLSSESSELRSVCISQRWP